MTKMLLVIDMTNGLTDPKSPGSLFKNEESAERVIVPVNQLISEFKERDFPVVFVKVAFNENYSDCLEHSSLFCTLKQFGVLKNGNWDTFFNPKLNYKEGDTVLIKKGISAFSKTNLADLIRELEVEEVVLTGLSTDKAIHATAIQLHDSDMPVTVISDACAAANDEIHQTLLHTLAEGIARVTTVEDYVCYLEESTRSSLTCS